MVKISSRQPTAVHMPVKGKMHTKVKELQKQFKKEHFEKDASPYLVQTAAKQPAGSQVFVTVDGGKVHVGVDENYVGSINSYNNFLTQFFANLFGLSAAVTFNGKTVHVNKAEYANWLASNTAEATATVDNIASYLDFNKLNVQAVKGRGLMRNNISAAKSNRLFEKMVTALVVDKDYEKAAKYAGKGANLEKIFWIREGYAPSFADSIKAGVDEDKAIEFRAGRYTALLYAAEKNNKAFCDFLVKLGANKAAIGQFVVFTKKITEVNVTTSLVKSEEFTSSDGRVLTRLNLKTSSQLQIEDQTSPKIDFTYSPESNGIYKIESKSPVLVERYTKNLERLTTRYL
ncbi:MAG: hypothetical protein LLF94_06410 [Chlamydiales bacterium]|nr:hypothetical protein [Chlamydiales bacterium]